MRSIGTVKDQTAEFAARIKAMGFVVYLAESRTYGFITNQEGTRVLSFSGEYGGLYGNYGPPSQESGTGWKLEECMWELRTAEQVEKALNCQAPSFCARSQEGKGFKYYSTANQYLEAYQASSRFIEVTEEKDLSKHTCAMCKWESPNPLFSQIQTEKGKKALCSDCSSKLHARGDI